MLYLVLSCFTLLLGPLFYRYFSRSTSLVKALDGFIFVTIGGIMLTHIIPELVNHGGLIAAACILLGALGPTLVERLFRRHSDLTHNFTILLGVFGLMFHSITDGGAISLTSQEHNLYLAVSIMIHRLPEGLAIWWIVRPQLGFKWAVLAIAVMLCGTISGFVVGEHYLEALSIENTYLLQSFVTGWVLHVILHQPHQHDNAHTKSHRYEYQAGMGSLVGCGFLLALLTVGEATHDHGHGEHGQGHPASLLSETHEEHAHEEHAHEEHAHEEHAHEEHAHEEHAHEEHAHEEHAHEEHADDAHEHLVANQAGPLQLLHWALTLAPWILLVYVSVFLRHRLNLSFSRKKPYQKWLAHLLGPESLILTYLFLGWQLALLYLVSGFVLVAWLGHQKIDVYHSMKTKKYEHPDGFMAQIDRSAPWVVFGLLIANLIGNPNLLLPNISAQILTIFILMMLMSFCSLGSVVLSITLAWSGWDIGTMTLLLLAAPLINIQQLKKMNGLQGVMIMVIVCVSLFIAENSMSLHFETLMLADAVHVTALVVLSLLYAFSLLRCGPRAFMASLFAVKLGHRH